MIHATRTATVKIESPSYGWARFDSDLSRTVDYIALNDGDGFTAHALDHGTLVGVCHLPYAATIEDAVRMAAGRVRYLPTGFREIAVAAAAV